MKLLELFGPLLPEDHLQIVIESIDEVNRLSELGSWSPSVVTRDSLNTVIKVGFPLVLAKSARIDALRNKILKSLLQKSNVEQSLLSELKAAALLSSFGANCVEYVSRKQNERTPDLRVVWSGGVVSDVEVVSGKKKAEHERVGRLARKIADAIGVPRGEFDVTIHCDSNVCDNTIFHIIENAKNVKHGEIHGEYGVWEVRGDSIIIREPNVVVVGGLKIQPPEWWRSSRLTLTSFLTMLGVKDEVEPRPQIRVVIGVPLNSYVNPVLRKATRSQAKGNAFVIAFDVSALPAAFRELKDILPGYFPQWDHVSGVLAFDDIFDPLLNKIGWSWSCYENLSANEKFCIELDVADSNKNYNMQTFQFLRSGPEGRYFEDRK